jgi:signal peptidase II
MAEALREDGLKKLRLWSPLAPLILALAALTFGIDQTHKWWMIHVYGIETIGEVEITPFFELVMAWNRGVSYGLFKTDAQWPLIAGAAVICAGLWAWANRDGNRLQAAALALVIGGALSNAFDRLVYGAVADFFHVFVGDFSWYVFNLADVAIVAGVGLLLYESFLASPGHGNA